MYEIAPELWERPFCFMKFSSEKWTLEALRNGNLYLNTIGHFRELEEKTKIRGMGDKDEGALILSKLDLSFFDYETGDLCLKGFAKRSELRFEEDLEKHAFCMCYLDFNNLEIIEEGSNYIKAKIIFTEEQAKEFEENFGEHVLIYSCGDFIENLKRSFKNQTIQWAAQKIRYTDLSINYQDRIESYINGGSDKYFWKDNYFINQKEYRVVLLNKDSKEPITIKIADMQEYSHLTTVDKVFSEGYCVEMHFDPEKHLVRLE